MVGRTYSQNVSSLALTVWDKQCLDDSEQKDHSINESMNELRTKGIVEQPLLHRVCKLGKIRKARFIVFQKNFSVALLKKIYVFC